MCLVPWQLNVFPFLLRPKIISPRHSTFASAFLQRKLCTASQAGESYYSPPCGEDESQRPLSGREESQGVLWGAGSQGTLWGGRKPGCPVGRKKARVPRGEKGNTTLQKTNACEATCCTESPTPPPPPKKKKKKNLKWCYKFFSLS